MEIGYGQLREKFFYLTISFADIIVSDDLEDPFSPDNELPRNY